MEKPHVRCPFLSRRHDVIFPTSGFYSECGMNRLTKITAAVLGLVLVVLVATLFLEAAAGPTHRAEDYDSYQDCIRGIPMEWLPNSLERQGAETACLFVHERRQIQR
jgi:hypothetical protein